MYVVWFQKHEQNLDNKITINPSYNYIDTLCQYIYIFDRKVFVLVILPVPFVEHQTT